MRTVTKTNGPNSRVCHNCGKRIKRKAFVQVDGADICSIECFDAEMKRIRENVIDPLKKLFEGL